VSSASERKSSGLADQLHLAIALLEELRELLARETTALATRSHGQTISLLGDKQHLIARLADLYGDMNDFLSRAGYSPDGEGLARCIQETAGSTELAGLYDTAIKALRACAAHNQTNGTLVERQRSAVDRALRLLFDRPDGGSRYHPSGRLEGLSPNRLIGEA
jgi:flagellar biosynthesis/type III secretory pathway chaperone